ncbi:DUF4231 domain-containing protein [[Limnothrix rosea] IAM M-220]|uniref:DUF4231 domain-containing protein n=1 Tax=[Limnothrix rosea] IAM M-220 TaxID=454133 RepID=UPI000960C097|nr:DUF4231 domain-containing protein [[Limnothrix rosea] IAM M-220]OKH10770.1 hypothetical protein NIES208_18255 [[Limnothrix rosea] IAM M-220]
MPHYLQDSLEPVIDKLDLTERQKSFIKGRWLDQLIYADKRASRDQKKYFRLRMVTIVGGVIVPALVSLNNLENTKLRNAIGWVTFATSLTVAISAAVEEFFQYGESYRRFRNTAEGMKIEGWSFFQLSGPYEDATSHAAAYKTFATHVENIIKKDVEGYNAEMMQKKELEQEEETPQIVTQSVQTVEKIETTVATSVEEVTPKPEVEVPVAAKVETVAPEPEVPKTPEVSTAEEEE